jgi:HAD superfamily hydrolase (TIGR01509 family)
VTHAFRAVLLDLDDTLYDRRRAFEAWAHALARSQLGRALDPEELAALHRHDARGHRPRGELAADARRLGLSIDPLRLPFQLAEYLEPEPLVREALGELAGRLRLAIVTNGGAAQRTKLARLGLASVPHAIFVSGELGVAKPDPAMFEHALRWAGVPADATLFVGDHPAIDLAPAAALGMATAWRVRGEWPDSLAPPTYRITRIAELGELCR